ncbi:MAG TPA: serine/threonine-protein kinase, partial [Pirellulaceae bacterium]|nr:serine/threonine-protein kinase [Pirellulaceae bacterium]
LADVIGADADERQRHGVAWRIQEHLQLVPDLMERAAPRRALLMAALMHDDSLGHTRADRERSLYEKFPEWADDIRTIVSLSSILDQVLHGNGTFAPGDCRGKYEFIERIGSGAFGQTWRVRDRVLRRDVALKILAPRPGVRWEAKRFLQEAQAIAAIDHQSVVRIHEAGQFEETGECYLDMQWVRGAKVHDTSTGSTACSTLDDLIRTRPVSPVQAATLIAAVARGLAAVHARGIIHRDIKPANILLDEELRPILADFGFAGFEEPDPSAQSSERVISCVGTLAFVAPEVARGEPPSPLSDLFSLGATLRNLLTRQPPRAPGANEDSITTVLRATAEQPLEPLSPGRFKLPATLVAICQRATAINPPERYASATELASELDHFVRNLPTIAYRLGWPGKTVLWWRRNVGVAAIGLASLVLIAVGTIWFIWQLRQERDAAQQAKQLAVRERDAAVAAREVIEMQNMFLARSFNSARGEQGISRHRIDFSINDAISLALRRALLAFPDRPLVEAAVLHFLAQVDIAIGEYDRARNSTDRALTIRESQLGQNHPDTVATRRLVADLMWIGDQRTEAEELYGQIWDQVRGSELENQTDGLWIQVQLALRTARSGDMSRAIADLERVAQLYKALPFAGGTDYQQSLNELVKLYFVVNDLDKAEQTQRHIVALTSSRLGTEDISTLHARQALAQIIRRRGRLADAATMYCDVALAYRQVVGEQHIAFRYVTNELVRIIEGLEPHSAHDLAWQSWRVCSSLPAADSLRLRSALALGKTLVESQQSAEAERFLHQVLAETKTSPDSAPELTSRLEQMLAEIGK